MADDLVVREWDCAGPGKYYVPRDYWLEHNALARAYLAVVAERDAAKLDHSLLSDDHRDLMQDVDGLRAQLAAMTAERDRHIEVWRYALTELASTKVERDAALGVAARRLEMAKRVTRRLTASEAARGMAAECLGRFRAAKAWIAADAWDNTEETRAKLEQAATWADYQFGRMSDDEIAAALKRSREPWPAEPGKAGEP